VHFTFSTGFVTRFFMSSHFIFSQFDSKPRYAYLLTNEKHIKIAPGTILLALLQTKAAVWTWELLFRNTYFPVRVRV